MRAFIDNVLKQLKEFFGRLSKKERTRLVILALVVIILAIVVVSLLGRTTYETLYRGLSPQDAAEIIAALDEMGVTTYKTEGTSTILVPKGMASDLQIRLSTEAVLSDEFDLSILSAATGFGVTDSEKKEYAQYQLGSTIRQQILGFSKIQRCSVYVSLAEKSTFFNTNNNTESSASVQLTVKGGNRLTSAEVDAIAGVVRASVPGISNENISITDSSMYRYVVGEGEENFGTDVNAHYDLEQRLKQDFEDQVLQLLTPIYGSGRLSISARVVLDFDKQTSQSVVFEPPIAGEMEGIIRSASELYENQRLDGADGGIPGTDTNGMGATEYPYGELEDGDEYRKSLVEKNYEINETRTNIEKALGTVKDLSIAIFIDSEAVAEDYTADVQRLVSKALGIGEDYIAVASAPFIEHGESVEAMIAAQEELIRQQRMQDILITVIMWAVILFLGLSFLSLARMLVKNMTKKPVAVAGGGIDYLAGDEEAHYDDIDLNAKPSGVEQLERFIDKDSRAVAQLLRNWLSDE